MRVQLLFQLIQIVLDRRITKTPQSVFRQLSRKGKLHGSARQHLSQGLFHRIFLLRQIMRLLDGECLTRHNGQWVLNTFLPPFPGSAFDRLFTNQLGKFRYTPVSAYLAVTSRCPAHCWHCSIRNRPVGELSFSQWQKTINELHGIGASLFGITGGEPLVREDLEDIVRTVKNGGGEALIFTSGVGLTEQRAIALRKAGLWAICVSLDRTDPREFEKMRGLPNALSIAQNALRNAKTAGLYTCINSVADRYAVTTGEYRRLYEMGQSLNVNEFRLIEPMPCGQLADYTSSEISPKIPLLNESPFLNPAQVDEIRLFHRETNRHLRLRACGKTPTKVCAFNEMESPELFGCAAGIRHLFIDPVGNVSPCDFTPLSFGNITDESMDTIWERMIKAMKRPRRHCLIQHQTKLVHEALEHGIPAPMEISLKTAEAFPEEDLPDFVRWIE